MGNVRNKSKVFNSNSSEKDRIANAGMKNNLCMVMQDGVEEFYTVSNVYNFETGAEISGGNVYGNSKELGIYRAMSGSLNVWDTSQLSAQ